MSVTPTGKVTIDAGALQALRAQFPLLDKLHPELWTGKEQVNSLYVNDRVTNGLAVALLAPVIKVAVAVRNGDRLDLEPIETLEPSASAADRLDQLLVEFNGLFSARKAIAHIYVDILGVRYDIFLPPADADQISQQLLETEFRAQYQAVQHTFKASV